MDNQTHGRSRVAAAPSPSGHVASTIVDLRRRSPSAASSSAISLYEGPRENQWRVGSAYDYAEPDLVSDWVKCAICLGPFYEPWAAISTCSHTFCQQCIQQHHRALSSKEDTEKPLPCPSCRTPNRLSDYRAAQPLIRNLVDSLKVYCPLKTRGCDWTGEREAVEHHLVNICGWAWVGEFQKDLDDEQGLVSETGDDEPRRRRRGVKCRCGARVMRKDWEQHCYHSCTVKWHKCEYCKTVVRAGNELGVEESHAATCTAVPAECQYCHEEILRGELPQHQAQSCLDALVSCTMARFGCSWEGPRHSFGLSEGLQGPQEEHAHARVCAFMPLVTYLKASDRRLRQLEAENVALRREVTGNQIALDASQEVLRGCVDTLGIWCQRRTRDESSEREYRRTHSASRVSASGGSVSGSTASEERLNDLIDWPFAEEDSRSASQNGQGSSPRPPAGIGESFVSSSSLDGEHRGPSRLETTINDLVSSITTLNTQDATLSHLLHDSRRESMYASVEVARLAEEVTGLRHGLHNIARHLQMRQSGWRGGVPDESTASGTAAETESKSAPSAAASASVSNTKSRLEATSGAGSSNNSGGSGTGSRYNTYCSGLDLGRGGPLIPGRAEGAPFPFLPYGTLLPPSPLHPLPQPHLPYQPSLAIPMPGVRRFWSGPEQTKL